MDQSLCKLTLVGPPHAVEDIIEILLAHEPPVRGFTTWAAEGHGLGFETASLSEKVRGRIERRVIVAVLTRSGASSILQLIASRIAIPHLTYWLEPVESFGQMLPKPVSAAPTLILQPSTSTL